MNKVIILLCGMLVLGTTAFAQDAKVSTKSGAKKCVPTKECAAKMGLSLEECKALCKKTCTKTDANTESGVASASAEAVLDSEMSLKECAAKMGMTVAECKAKCASTQKSATTADGTQVAAALVSSEAVPKQVDKKKVCQKGNKKCCKK